MSGSLLGLAENPFSEGHDARFLYPSRAHWSVVTRLRRAIEDRESFVYLTGPAGCGKTTAIIEFLAGMESYTAVTIAATPSLTVAEFRERVLSGLGFESGESPGRPMDRIEAILREAHARDEGVILVVDESQNLDSELLGELMALNDLESGGQKLLQIILAGQPVLEKLLSRPGCESLRPRIGVRCWVGALSAEETEGYIRHRVSVVSGSSRSLFPSDSCQAVYRLTQGIPRDINLLASEALLQAAGAGASTVKPDHVAVAARVIGIIRPEAAAWVARFGHACVTPGIESRIGAALLLSEMLDRPGEEPTEEGTLSHEFPERRDAPRGRLWKLVAWAAGALLVFAVGFLLSQVTLNSLPRGAAYRAATTSSDVGGESVGATSAPGDAPSAGPAAPAAPSVSRARSSAAMPRSASEPRRSRPAAPTRRAMAGSTARHSAAAPSSPLHRYGLEVATFAAESRAMEKRDELAARIHVACHVVTSLEDGAPVYHVVVGPLTSRSAAESLGTSLFARGVVGEARVVPWPAADSTR